MFRTWPEVLLPEVEVCAIQFPGRENHLRDRLLTQLPEAVEKLAHLIHPYLTRSFAFFGHSLGAFIAFELVRKLRKQGIPGPLHLFVSGQRAPQHPDPFPPLHHLPEPEFVERLTSRYNRIPTAVLQCRELMQLLLPVLRADFTMNETYRYVEEAPLDCPITAFGGLQDPEAGKKDISSWEYQTCSTFKHEMIPGDHFFLESSRIELVHAVSRALKQSIDGV